MRPRLFFMGPLTRAGAGGSRPGELRRAMLTIERLRRLPGYARGYRQYRRFIAVAIAHAKKLKVARIRRDSEIDQLIDLLDGRLTEATMSHAMLDEHLRWPRALKERGSERAGGHIWPPLPTLLLLAGDDVYFEARLAADDKHYLIEDIAPGRYTVMLDNGRVLWMQDLSEKHVLWRRAYPGRPFPVAAMSGSCPSAKHSSLTCSLCDGAILLQVLPDLEVGRIDLLVKGIRAEVRCGE